MTFPSFFAGQDGPPPRKKPVRAMPMRSGKWRPSPLAITLIVVAALFFFIFLAAQIWTEVLWFKQINYSSVFFVEWGWKIGLSVVAVIVMAAILWLNLFIARRRGPVPGLDESPDSSVQRYRKQIQPHSKLIGIALPLVLALMFAGSTGASWRSVVMWLNRNSFGIADPQFGMDVSFYVYTLPILQGMVGFLLTAIFLSALLAGAAYFLDGAISAIKLRGAKVASHARKHMGILAALFTLGLAARYWLDRYALLVGDNSRFAGASFSDVNATLPGRTIMAGIAVAVAIMFIVAAFRGTWHIPAAGIAMMILSAVVVGWAYPAVVQKFQVEPNAVEMESKYIQRNIDGTLHAYGLDEVEATAYTAKTDVSRGQLRKDSESTASIRLLDPNIAAPTFNQLQQNRQYYSFDEQLSVDRYTIDDSTRDTVIAVRELNLAGLGAEQRNWVNDHTVFTHGFGVAAAYGNTQRSDGRPDFFQQGIPSTGDLGDYEPRVYFGQKSPIYSIVGAPEGADPWELDYPDDNAPNGQVMTTFTGDGGPSVGSMWNRLLFAIRFQSTDMFFSERVTENSQILFHRDPHDRVAKVAPYLTLDSRAYPAVVDMDGDPDTPKRLVWIIDGYTTSNDYPYSARESLAQATTDSLGGETGFGMVPDKINYIRNSVKAVVDAYDGSVKLYQWDKDDPILKTWSAVFPGKIRPTEEISGDLMAHMRYPEDLFKVQRTLLSRYHVTDAASFYSGGDFWNQPADPTIQVSAGVARPTQPPYYMTLQMPGQDKATFSLTSSFIPGGKTDRNVLTGFLAADADAGNEPGKIAESYGKLRLLELPRDLTVPGPGQVQNIFDSNATISRELNLLQQGGSDVQRGNLLTLPVGDGLLYVQPIYVKSRSGTSYPLLRYVLTAFGDSVGFSPTLDGSLDDLFGGDSGAKAGDADVKPERPDISDLPDGEFDPNSGTTEKPDDPASTEEPSDPDASGDGPGAVAPPAGGDDGAGVAGSADERLRTALDDANRALRDSQEALRSGDWNTYGKAQDRLQNAIERAVQAQEEIDGK